MIRTDPERLARVVIASVTEPGDPRVAAMIAEFGAEDAWAAILEGRERPSWQRRAALVDADRFDAECAKYGLRVVIPGDDEWPRELDALSACEPVCEMRGAPPALWVKGPGRLDEVPRRGVAVVGSRACTNYGEWVTQSICADLAHAGKIIVSGGAYGIDAAAHRAALGVGGLTVVVSARGLDGAYPASHRELFCQASMTGLVVSEFAPGQTPTRSGFLARNRLIAALTLGTIIVEGAKRSGAKNTVTWADALSLPVMAVPGPVTSSLSETPNGLIRDHRAQLITDATDVMAVLAPLGTTPEPQTLGAARRLDSLTPDQFRVREALPGSGSMDLDTISLASGVPTMRCAVVLAELEELGMVYPDSLMTWSLVR